MRRYYTRTFVGMGVVFAALVAAAVLANSVARQAKLRYAAVLATGTSIRERSAILHEKALRLRVAISPVRNFTKAWEGAARLAEKDAAEHIRSEMESIAQRQLGLVTDNAITPQPERYSFAGYPMPVQRVTLRASGKDLAALLTWLGLVEEKYPASVIESCEFSSNVGGNTGLTLRLVQPLLEPAQPRLMVAPAVPDIALLPEAIAAVAWSRYLPASVKAAGAVGFERNPLQPAVMAEQRMIPLVHDESDEITPKLENALDGRVRSVIRGGSPIVVIDGRVFRVGDELVIGSGRDKLLPETKTKLKRVDDARLVLQVSGGSADRPIHCDVSYELPSFLRSR